MPPHEFKDASRIVIGAAIEVHKKLGPGYLESIYERALCLELSARGVAFESQSEFVVLYNGTPVGVHRLDLLVEGNLIVELKATNRLDDVFYQVVRPYLTALRQSEGLLVNFGTTVLQVKRIYANHNTPAIPTCVESIGDD